MKKHQKNSIRAAALQISLSIALLVLSVVLFASSFKAASPSASSAAQPSSVAQPGFYPQLYPNLPQHPPAVSPPDGGQTITVTAPIFSMDISVPIATIVTQPVNTTQITPSLDVDGNCTDNATCFIGFQADMVFDSAIAVPSPSGSSAQGAGLTGNNWTVGSNVLNTGPGTLRTLRVSAFSNDGVTPLNGAGVLYNTRWVRVSSTPGDSTTLVWQPFPNDFEFIDTDLNVTIPDQTNGLITITGPTATPGGPTATPTVAPTATPTVAPTATPTVAPTATATVAPTATATVAPTATATVAPTATASVAPTATATVAPTATATVAPTATATVAPTATATVAPTATATVAPTATATVAPTATATVAPTATATVAPTATATVAPTATATVAPTATATVAPTATATVAPTATPTVAPTATPTPQPTATPTSTPPTPTPSGSCPPITVKPNNLPDGKVGQSYHKNIHASGGSGPYVFTVTTGSLPPGLTLASDGDLSGTFTAEGNFPFTITATDQNGCTGKRQYNIRVKCRDIKVRPNHLPDGTLGTPYSKTITASGGTEPYVFTVQSGSLPDGLTLAPNGVLSGTPTEEGNFTFTILATDAYGCTGRNTYSVSVKCRDITVKPNNLPNGKVGVPYNKTITATGGNAPYTFAVASGNLPTGLSLSTSGVISGTPTVATGFNFVITATDQSGCSGKRHYSITVSFH